MVMLQITNEKKEEMGELCEKLLHYGGKLMSCIENMDENAMGERRMIPPIYMRDGGRYGSGNRGGYGSRGGYGMRDGDWESRGYYGMRDDDYNDMDYMGERRGRRRY